MFKKNPDKKVTWLDAAMLVVAVALVAAPVYTTDTAVRNDDQIDLPERGSGEGHGSYCDVPDQEGVYLYGRDLGEELRSFDAFDEWCVQVGGELAWAE